MNVTPTRRILAAAAALALAAGIGAVAPTAALAGQGYPDTVADAQAALTEALGSSGATSIVASLTDQDDTVWTGAAGQVNARGATPTEATMYGVGSISKMIATTAVMRLVDQGRIDLDRPVVSYLPQFRMKSPQYRQITVRMLLNHTAGLPGTTYDDSATTTPYPADPKAVLANLARSSLKTTPGAMSVYCNDCFTVAGEVVAAVAGTSYPRYVRRHILTPLGMTHSGYLTKRLPAPGTYARVVADGRQQPVEIVNAPAAGGLWSSAADMARFARMMLGQGTLDGHQVLTPAAVAEMGRLQIDTTLDPVEDAPLAYGLGWDTVAQVNLDAVGQRAWSKNGDSADYHGYVIVLPDAGLAAYVGGAGTTFSSHQAATIAQRIVLHALAERGDIPAVPDPVGSQQPDRATASEDDVNAMLGHYLTAQAALRVVRDDAGALTLQYYDGSGWQRLVGPVSFRTDGQWWPVLGGDPVALRTVTGWGRTYLINAQPMEFGNAMTNLVAAQRVTSTGPMARAWRQKLGTWLPVGERPDSTRWLRSPATRLTRIPGLPGYLTVSGASIVDARDPGIASMFLQIPLGAGADLDDLVPIGGGRLRVGNAVLRRADTVAALHRGANGIRIGANGFAEWRTLPRAGAITVRGGTGWHLYDRDLAPLARRGRTVTAPAGARIVVFGRPATTLTVTVS